MMAPHPDPDRCFLGVLSRLLRTLSEKGVITHTLAEPDFSTDGLEAKFMGLCRLNATSRQRRIGRPAVLSTRVDESAEIETRRRYSDCLISSIGRCFTLLHRYVGRTWTSAPQYLAFR